MTREQVEEKLWHEEMELARLEDQYDRTFNSIDRETIVDEMRSKSKLIAKLKKTREQMKFRDSPTLSLIMKHWEGKLPDVDEDGFGSVSFPFNLQEFCNECDAYLALISHDPSRKLWAKQTILQVSKDSGTVAWQVREGSELDKSRKAPVAWFTNLDDVNKFIFAVNGPVEEAVKLKSENARLQAEVDALHKELESINGSY